MFARFAGPDGNALRPCVATVDEPTSSGSLGHQADFCNNASQIKLFHQGLRGHTSAWRRTDHRRRRVRQGKLTN